MRASACSWADRGSIVVTVPTEIMDEDAIETSVGA